jgi:hypothetical protein
MFANAVPEYKSSNKTNNKHMIDNYMSADKK